MVLKVLVLLVCADLYHSAPIRAAETTVASLAAQRFHDLTTAERRLLEFADIGNPNRGEWAVCGSSSNPKDPSNDPSKADLWSRERDIRAELIRWLATDRRTIDRVDPNGVRILGARIIGPLNLSHIRVPFALTAVRCAIPDRMRLENTEIPQLDLNGTYSGEIFASGLTVTGDMFIGWDDHDYGGEFHAAGEVYMEGAKVGGRAVFGGGQFRHSNVALFDRAIFRFASAAWSSAS